MLQGNGLLSSEKAAAGIIYGDGKIWAECGDGRLYGEHGAYIDDDTAGSDQGSAYVFLRTGSSWSEQAKLTASDAAATAS